MLYVVRGEELLLKSKTAISKVTLKEGIIRTGRVMLMNTFHQLLHRLYHVFKTGLLPLLYHTHQILHSLLTNPSTTLFPSKETTQQLLGLLQEN